jgi:hypothetical protein
MVKDVSFAINGDAVTATQYYVDPADSSEMNASQTISLATGENAGLMPRETVWAVGNNEKAIADLKYGRFHMLRNDGSNFTGDGFTRDDIIFTEAGATGGRILRHNDNGLYGFSLYNTREGQTNSDFSVTNRLLEGRWHRRTPGGPNWDDVPITQRFPDLDGVINANPDSDWFQHHYLVIYSDANSGKWNLCLAEPAPADYRPPWGDIGQTLMYGDVPTASGLALWTDGDSFRSAYLQFWVGADPNFPDGWVDTAIRTVPAPPSDGGEYALTYNDSGMSWTPKPVSATGAIPQLALGATLPIAEADGLRYEWYRDLDWGALSTRIVNIGSTDLLVVDLTREQRWNSSSNPDIPESFRRKQNLEPGNNIELFSFFGDFNCFDGTASVFANETGVAHEVRFALDFTIMKYSLFVQRAQG